MQKLLAQGSGEMATRPDTHTPHTGEAGGRSRPQVQGPDNPCVGLFTSPPLIEGTRGALIFVPSSLLGHRAKVGRAMGQHLARSVSQIPRSTGSTGL